MWGHGSVNRVGTLETLPWVGVLSKRSSQMLPCCIFRGSREKNQVGEVRGHEGEGCSHDLSQRLCLLLSKPLLTDSSLLAASLGPPGGGSCSPVPLFGQSQICGPILRVSAGTCLGTSGAGLGPQGWAPCSAFLQGLRSIGRGL